MPLSRHMTALVVLESAKALDAPYFIAPKRLSNEFDDTIGAEPAT